MSEVEVDILGEQVRSEEEVYTRSTIRSSLEQ